MPKVIRYTKTYHEVGIGGQSAPKYVAGQCYPVTDETERHVTHGIAEEVDAPADPDKADAAVAKAEARAAEAAGQADAARAAAEASKAAAAIAEKPAE